MFWTVAVTLAVLWLLGMITTFTIGGSMRILLVTVVIVLVFRLLQGRLSW